MKYRWLKTFSWRIYVMHCFLHSPTKLYDYLVFSQWGTLLTFFKLKLNLLQMLPPYKPWVVGISALYLCQPDEIRTHMWAERCQDMTTRWQSRSRRLDLLEKRRWTFYSQRIHLSHKGHNNRDLSAICQKWLSQRHIGQHADIKVMLSDKVGNLCVQRFSEMFKMCTATRHGFSLYTR